MDIFIFNLKKNPWIQPVTPTQHLILLNYLYQMCLQIKIQLSKCGKSVKASWILIYITTQNIILWKTIVFVGQQLHGVRIKVSVR